MQRAHVARDKDPPVVHEDENFLVINKPAGISTHGGADDSLNLAAAVLSYLEDKLPPSLSFMPGPLHRLDRGTSGLIVFGKSLEGARFFTRALLNGGVQKTYIAIVEGELTKTEVWEDWLFRDTDERKTYLGRGSTGGDGAKKAICRVRPVFSNGKLSVLEVELCTGRTHQIRAQAAARGHPLLGDVKYGGLRQNVVGADRKSGGKKNESGFYLHAKKLEINFEGKSFSFDAPLPLRFESRLKALSQGRLLL
jgi:23S rRNA pseudouridine955/2504/2580 synthase